MADNKDTKNYQKTQSRTVSKRSTGNVAIQSIKYLVMNPLAVNYIMKQDVQASGDNSTIHATQSITDSKPYQYASITN